MLRSIANLIIHRAITIQIGLPGMMSMTVKTEHQARELMGIIVENLSHVVIKLLRKGRSMHTDNGTVEISRIRLALLFHEIEVRYRAGIVILNGIGIETYKLHPAGDKAEIRLAERLSRKLGYRFPNSHDYQAEPRTVSSASEDGHGSTGTHGSTKVGKVSTMNHEIEEKSLAAIDIINLTLQIIQPLMRITDHNEPDGSF